MRRLYLNTTYEEKDQVRSLGARWDSGAKRWYILPDQDPAPFARWLDAKRAQTTESPKAEAPPDTEVIPVPKAWVNVRAPSFYLLSTTQSCGRCELKAPAFGFVLPRSYESMALQLNTRLSDGQQPNSIYSYPDLLRWLEHPKSRQWISHGIEALPYDIYHLSKEIVDLMRQTAPNYRKVTKFGQRRWANVCPHCRASLPDVRPDGQPALIPRSSTGAAYTDLTPIGMPFEAGAAGLATGIEFVQRMNIQSP